MAYIHKNKDDTSHTFKTGTGQSQQITPLAKLPAPNKPRYLHATMSAMLKHTHSTNYL